MPARKRRRRQDAFLVVSLSPAGEVVAYDTQELVKVRVPVASPPPNYWDLPVESRRAALAQAWATSNTFTEWEGPASMLPRLFAVARKGDPVSQAMIPGFARMAPQRGRLLEKPLRERARELEQSVAVVKRLEILAAASTMPLTSPDHHLPRLLAGLHALRKKGSQLVRKAVKQVLNWTFLPSSPNHPFHTLFNSRVVEGMSTELMGPGWRTRPEVSVESLDEQNEEPHDPRVDIEGELIEKEQRDTLERLYKDANLSVRERDTYERRMLGDSATGIARDRGVAASAIRTEYLRARRKIDRAREKWRL